MYEKLRNAIGITMIILCIMVCIMPSQLRNKQNNTRYKSGDCPQWAIREIVTERNGPIRVNTAGKEELTVLKGIGESIAALIISEREINGPFYYAEDLEAVKGIGPRILERLREDIDLTIDESRE